MINFPFITVWKPLFDLGCVLLLCARSPRGHDDVGSPFWHVSVFEGLPDRQQAINTILLYSGWTFWVPGNCNRFSPLGRRHSVSIISFIIDGNHNCEKKLAFLQLLRSSEAAEKLRKSFVKAGGIGTCGKAGFYAGLLKNRLLRSFYATAEKLQKSRLFYSFYEAFTQSFVKIVIMSKSCGNAAITQVPIPPAFAKLLHAAFMQTCVKPVFLQLLRRSA